MEHLAKLEHDYEIFSAQLDRASRELNSHSETGDAAAHLAMGIYLAVEAQKDISWQEALDGDLREDAIKALDKEWLRS